MHHSIYVYVYVTFVSNKKPCKKYTVNYIIHQGRRKMICIRGAEINNLTLITFIILITVGASERSQNEHVRWPENV